MNKFYITRNAKITPALSLLRESLETSNSFGVEKALSQGADPSLILAVKEKHKESFAQASAATRDDFASSPLQVLLKDNYDISVWRPLLKYENFDYSLLITNLDETGKLKEYQQLVIESIQNHKETTQNESEGLNLFFESFLNKKAQEIDIKRFHSLAEVILEKNQKNDLHYALAMAYKNEAWDLVDFLLTKIPLDNDSVKQIRSLTMKIVNRLIKDGYKIASDLGDNYSQMDRHAYLSMWKNLIPEDRVEFMTSHPPQKDYWWIEMQRIDLYSFDVAAKKLDLYKDLPLIKDILVNENKKLRLTGFNLSFSFFFKNNSLKDACFKAFGTKSNKICKYIYENFFEIKGDILLINDSAFEKLQFFFNTVGDVNHVTDLLKIDFNEKVDFRELSDDLELVKIVPKTDLNEKIDFRELSENLDLVEIVPKLRLKKWISTFNKDYRSFIDASRMLRHNPQVKTNLRTDFSTIKEFHDYLVIEVDKIKHADFSLNQEEKFPSLVKAKSIKLPLNYTLKVAKTSHELIEWGRAMNHCVGFAGYGQKALRGECILIGVFKNDKPEYCMEVSPKGKLIQFEGKGRKSIPEEIKRDLIEQLKAIEILNSSVN